MGQKQKKKNLLSKNILGTGRPLGVTFIYLIGTSVIGKYGRNMGLKKFAILRQNEKKKILLSFDTSCVYNR